MTRSNLGSKAFSALLVAGALLILATVAVAANRVLEHAAFVTENDAAMTRMMAGMHVRYSGDVDQDFAAMMIAHHQGAIDMAQAELRHGKNEQLRRIAQEIVVEQQEEIAAMHLAVGTVIKPSVSGLLSDALCRGVDMQSRTASAIYNMD